MDGHFDHFNLIVTLDVSFQIYIKIVGGLGIRGQLIGSQIHQVLDDIVIL